VAVAENETIRNHAAFIWLVADLLRSDYKDSEYGRVILPMVVLRRIDCVREPTKAQVLEKFGLPVQIERLDRADLLYRVVSKFCDIDFHPDVVSSLEMGYFYELDIPGLAA
jgi:hypothetical protein